MKSQASSSKDPSTFWDIFWSYPNRLSLLGEVELALYSSTYRERFIRLVKNEHLWFFIVAISGVNPGPKFHGPNIRQYMNIYDMSMFAILLTISFLWIRLLYKDLSTPGFAICSGGVWFGNVPWSWERIRKCDWERYRKNRLVVSGVDQRRTVKIPADRCEEVQAAIRKHDKMRPDILEGAPISGGTLSEDES